MTTSIDATPEPIGFAKLTPEARRRMSQLGGLTRAATYDMGEFARQGAAGLRNRFRREVDPDGTLSVAERERRAEALHRAHMLKLNMARWGNRPRVEEPTAKPAKKVTKPKTAPLAVPAPAQTPVRRGPGKRGGRPPFWWLEPEHASAS